MVQINSNRRPCAALLLYRLVRAFKVSQTHWVTENPFPWELNVNYNDATKALLLNRETGDVYYINPNMALQNNK